MYSGCYLLGKSEKGCLKCIVLSWFYLSGAEWRRCINVRCGGESIVPVDPVMFVEKQNIVEYIIKEIYNYIQ